LLCISQEKYHSFSNYILQSGLKTRHFHDKIHLGYSISYYCIGSASGLFYQGNSLFMISDNSGFLYEYNITNGTVNEYPLLKMLLKHTKARQT
jgi:hypothetical protein